VTYHTLETVGGKTGKLVLQGAVPLTPDELRVGAQLAGRGKEVIARPASGVGKSADFLVDGKPTELKTISNVRAQTAGSAATKTIKEADGSSQERRDRCSKSTRAYRIKGAPGGGKRLSRNA
jgi:hypothetical protein